MGFKTRTLVFPEPFKVALIEESVPEPSFGEVLVETLVTLISTGTELTAYSGSFPREKSAWAEYVKYPFRPGYCNVGQVIKVGEDVEGLAEGDVVVSRAPHTEYYVHKAATLTKVPEGIDPKEATFHTIAAGVMNSVRLAGVKLGESVVVVGAGLLGQMAAQFARLAGGFPVISVDLSDYRLQLARKSSADVTVNPQSEDVYEAVRRATKGRMADVVFEVTGNPQVLEWAIKLVKKMGRLVVLSSPRGPSTIDFHDEVNFPSRVIIGTHFTSQPSCETPFYPWTWSKNTELFLEMLKQRRIKVSHLVSHVFPWSEGARVYDFLYRNRLRCMGVLLDFRAEANNIVY